MRRLLLLFAFVGSALLLECVTVDDRLYACDSAGECPAGQRCEADGLCHLGSATGGGTGGGLLEDGGADSGVDSGTDAGVDAGSCRMLGQTGCLTGADCCNGLLCNGGRCEVLGDSCDYPVTLPFPGTFPNISGTTVGAINDFAGCSSGTTNDVFYTFSAEGSLQVTVTRLQDAGFEPNVALLSDCGAAATKCALGANGSASFSATNLPPRVWRLVVDTRNSTPGSFRVDAVASHAPLTPGDICEKPRQVVVSGGTPLVSLGPFNNREMSLPLDPNNPCTTGAHDLTYAIDTTLSGTLHVVVTPSGPWDVKLALTKGLDCGSTTTAVACLNATGEGGSETLNYAVPDGGGRYYLWLTGAGANDLGDYTGTIELQ